jgi:hypothetical protein
LIRKEESNKNDVHALIFMAESYMGTWEGKNGEVPPPDIKSSDDPNRKEIVFFNIETKSTKTKTMFIIVNDNEVGDLLTSEELVKTIVKEKGLDKNYVDAKSHELVIGGNLGNFFEGLDDKKEEDEKDSLKGYA